MSPQQDREKARIAAFNKRKAMFADDDYGDEYGGGAGGGVFKNTTLFAVLPSDHCSVYKFAPFEV